MTANEAADQASRQVVELFDDVPSHLLAASEDVMILDVLVHTHCYGRPAGVSCHLTSARDRRARSIHPEFVIVRRTEKTSGCSARSPERKRRVRVGPAFDTFNRRRTLMRTRFARRRPAGCRPSVIHRDRPDARRPAPAPATNAAATTHKGNEWRASKLIGVNIYNEQNEKLGDINEIILEPNGKRHRLRDRRRRLPRHGRARHHGRAGQDQVRERADPRDHLVEQSTRREHAGRHADEYASRRATRPRTRRRSGIPTMAC